jgi:hypothetical protein
MEILGLPVAQVLGFTVLAAFVTVIGNLFALFLKDVLAVRSFERWKARQSLASAYRKYREPIFLSAGELARRLHQIAVAKSSEEENIASLDLLKQKNDRPGTSAEVDDYYMKYRLTSNIYRLCSLLGWLELYRSEIVMLDSGSVELNRRLEDLIYKIRGDLANGHLNNNSDWSQWRDALIFHEVQRAIGHRMFVQANGRASLLDYGTFCEILEAGSSAARWMWPAAIFFESLGGKKDFRLVRMQMLVVHLNDLMWLLEPKHVPPEHVAAARQIEERLRAAGYPV